MRADLTQSPGNGWPEIRAENALFGVMLENARFARGWVVEVVGLKLVTTTQSSNRSPPRRRERSLSASSPCCFVAVENLVTGLRDMPNSRQTTVMA
jgi:hypothetical protein